MILSVTLTCHCPSPCVHVSFVKCECLNRLECAGSTEPCFCQYGLECFWSLVYRQQLPCTVPVPVWDPHAHRWSQLRRSPDFNLTSVTPRQISHAHCLFTSASRHSLSLSSCSPVYLFMSQLFTCQQPVSCHSAYTLSLPCSQCRHTRITDRKFQALLAVSHGVPC